MGIQRDAAKPSINLRVPDSTSQQQPHPGRGESILPVEAGDANVGLGGESALDRT